MNHVLESSHNIQKTSDIRLPIARFSISHCYEVCTEDEHEEETVMMVEDDVS